MKKASDFLLIIFAILLFLVSYRFDRQINLFFKGIRLEFFNFIFSIITNFGVVIFVMLVVPSIIFYKKNKKSIYLLWSAFIISIILAFVIKLIVLRQRPAEAFTYPVIDIINYSFPSMHSMVVFALLPVLVKKMPKQKIFWVAFAFLVAFSRVYFGFHFLSDAVFGGFFGYFIGDYLLDLYERKKL